MEMDKMQVVWKNQKELRCGYTTGSCAAAAAKAAAAMLFSGEEIRQVSLMTPKGIELYLEVEKIQRENESVSCAIQKDSGDDPDVTNGIFVYAKVTKKKEKGMTLDGGIGVGRFTRKVLEQEAGEAAINKVPRQMIREAVQSQIEKYDWDGGADVLIYVPQGVEIAKKTFNPRLGIEGGISVLGTSGIVEPMSSQALLDTIKVELNQKKAEGYGIAAVSPGNYGLDYMKKTYGYDLDRSVKCSNFIGDTIDMAITTGFEKMLLTGHIGKLVKVAGGIMNTHSREGDCRMEVLAAASVRNQVPYPVLEEILQCVTTEEAVRKLDACGKKDAVMQELLSKIMFYLNKRAAGKMQIEVILYSNEFGDRKSTRLNSSHPSRSRMPSSA